MSRAFLLALLFLLALARGVGAGDPIPPLPPPTPSPPAGRVVAAIGKAASENAALPAEKRVHGDALADAYVRRAAVAADGDATAFLVGLAHALDPDATLAKNPLTRSRFSGLEPAEAAAARAKVMGAPTLRGRDDLLLHFFVSAGLSAVVGERLAAVAGSAKEIADLRTPSGFSFVDLLADDAGISFQRWLSEKDTAARLARVAKEFAGPDHFPDPLGLPEGISKETFERDFGSLVDPRFLVRRKEVRDRVAVLAAKREPPPTPAPVPAPTK